MTKLESRLGYVFRDRTLLRLALTHPSYVLKDREPDNQRLEFLGDAVLQLSVSQALYRRYPEMKEGKLTRRRAALVCEANLAGIARRLGLGGQLLLSNGEELLHGREFEHDGELLFQDDGLELKRIYTDHSEDVLAVGTLRQYADRLECGDQRFFMTEISSMAMVQTHLLLFSRKGAYYELRSSTGVNLRKYLEIWKEI